MTDYWKIDKSLIKHVCAVARLELTEEEEEKFMKQLEDVLKAFKKIDEVDVSNTQPAFHPIEIKNEWREDAIAKYEWDPLSNTRHKEDGYFKGPKIV
jgi:aspartyl-tRNA(Asn)/glutamyl-tRNA(Gln) amidotransferase subunit C